jgi:hypothetical protein
VSRVSRVSWGVSRVSHENGIKRRIPTFMFAVCHIQRRPFPSGIYYLLQWDGELLLKKNDLF